MTLTDCTEIEVEMAEGGLLEPLVITEEGDVTERVAIVSCSREVALKREEEHTGEDENEDSVVTKMCLEDQSLVKQQTAAEDDQTGEAVGSEEDKQDDEKPEETENVNDGQKRGDSENERQTHEAMKIHEKPEKSSDTEDGEFTQSEPQVEKEKFDSSEQPHEGTQSQEEDLKKVCGLCLFYLPGV